MATSIVNPRPAEVSPEVFRKKLRAAGLDESGARALVPTWPKTAPLNFFLLGKIAAQRRWTEFLVRLCSDEPR